MNYFELSRRDILSTSRTTFLSLFHFGSSVRIITAVDWRENKQSEFRRTVITQRAVTANARPCGKYGSLVIGGVLLPEFRAS